MFSFYEYQLRSVRVPLRKGGGAALYPTLHRAGEVNLGLLGR
jgi:hypothetical protein